MHRRALFRGLAAVARAAGYTAFRLQSTSRVQAVFSTAKGVFVLSRSLLVVFMTPVLFFFVTYAGQTPTVAVRIQQELVSDQSGESSDVVLHTSQADAVSISTKTSQQKRDSAVQQYEYSSYAIT